jgi:flagellar FliJ protein
MPQSLKTLLDIATRERDQAAAALAQAEQQLRAQQQQWEQLQAYRADYAARAPAHGGRAAPIEALRTHQAFMGRLDQALAHQQRVLHAAEGEAQLRRQTLLQRETRLASVRKLMQRRVDTATQAADRAEQRRTDEAALQRHWHQRAVPH